MKNEKLLNAIGEIDDDLIFDAVNETKKRKSWTKWGSLAALLVLCVGAGFFGAGLREAGIPNISVPEFVDSDNPTVTNSIVILDVNPSIALTVNADDKIVTAEALNEDGKIVLNEMELADIDMTVAVNAIIGSMLQKGYLSDLQNAILVSVENNDAERSAALQERISAIIGNALQNGNLDGTVLSQTLNDTAVLDQMVLEHDISLGKAAFIQEVISQDETLTVEKLAPLSITEIALISQSKNITCETLTQSGIASDKAYISREAAVDIAYAFAGVSTENVTATKVEFDSEDGIMVYEVEFRVGTVEYEYDIDARTGQLMKYELEDKGMTDQNHNSTQQPSGTQQASGSQQPSEHYIGEEAAKKAALENAGIATDAVNYINVWLDYDDGRPEHYDVEFTVGNVEYKYEIDLYSGTVLEYETEDHGSHNTSAPDHDGEHNTAPNPPMEIDMESAKAMALSHAGLTAPQVSNLEAEYDYDHGVAVYEVEFKYNGYEYEYKIDAATGDILEYEIDD